MFSRNTSSDTIVLSFGPSILTGEAELATVVAEVRWQLRRGRRVVVVPSALWGASFRLASSAAKASGAKIDRTAALPVIEIPDAAASAVARVINAGPQAAAGLISIALSRAEIASTILDARDLGFISSGPATDATPSRIDEARLLRELDRARVVIVPGGEALTETGEAATLGVGGSSSSDAVIGATSADVSAVFIASAIDATVQLVRDTDGVFEGNPYRRVGGRPRRFRTIAWDLVSSIAPSIVSARAIEIAEARGVTVRIAAPGSDAGTLLSSVTAFDAPVLPREAATSRALEPVLVS